MADKQIVFSDQEKMQIEAIVIDKDKRAGISFFAEEFSPSRQADNSESLLLMRSPGRAQRHPGWPSRIRFRQR